MKYRIFLIITLLPLLFLAACNAVEVEQPQDKEAYQAEIQVRLDELNQQIEELKVEAEQMIGEDLNAEDVNRVIEELEAQTAMAAQELEELSVASEEAWEDFKPGLEAALDELEKAYQEARANFEES